MLIIVGSMQGTMVSLASMTSFGSLASERSRYSLVRRGCLSKGNWVKKKRWHCVSLSVCKYSATTATDLVSEQSNTYRGGKSDDSDVGFPRKPTPKPVLMSSGSTWNSGDGDGDGKLGGVEERNKVIESLGEVLEKAENLETSRVSKPGSRSESRVVSKSIPSNTNSTSTAGATQNSKTLKSVWRKGDNVATVQKEVKGKNGNTSKTIVKEETKKEARGKVESQAPPSTERKVGS